MSLALLRHASALQLCIYFGYLLIVVATARLPVFGLLRISLLVVPFAGIFALMIYLSGDVRRAILILSKTYLSAFAVLVCIASTPVADLAGAARSLYVPTFLVQVTQLIYRYLFVLSGETQVMRIAFTSRGGHAGLRSFKPASGMVAVLFGRALEKAGSVHNAMLSRGFTGTLFDGMKGHLRFSDFVGLFAGLVLISAVHFI